MPKAKPISLHPLIFDDAIKALINVDPASVRIPSKRTRIKSTGKGRAEKPKK